MTYAQGRVFNDADSHIMELPNFLKGTVICGRPRPRKSEYGLI